MDFKFIIGLVALYPNNNKLSVYLVLIHKNLIFVQHIYLIIEQHKNLICVRHKNLIGIRYSI